MYIPGIVCDCGTVCTTLKYGTVKKGCSGQATVLQFTALSQA